MKKIHLLKQLFIITICIVLELSSFPVVAIAQEAGNEVQASSAGQLLLPQGENQTPPLNLSDDSAPSARFQPPTRIRSLFKKTYRANEAVTVMVDYAKAAEIETTVFNTDGETVSAKVEIISDSSPVALKISPPRNFKPGRYRIKVETTSGQVTTQDFTWGVLAINTNKSIFLPNETAKLHLAVLDETGMMVCNADVTLEITDPNGVKNTMTTSESSIKVNPVCTQRILTLEPDYEARYQTGIPGSYQMQLTAVTPNGTYTIQDSFLVQESVPFDVERSTITRVFPPVTYPVVFNVTANQDFEGVIQEVVPDNFEVTKHPELSSYDEESVVSASEAESSVLEAPIFDIGLPFKGNERLTQGFGGIHRDPGLKAKYAKYGVLGHDGVDFGVPIGTEVVAVDGGKILIARENFDYGTTIIIEHTWGRSYYGHLSELKVEEDQIVKKGDVIGLSGNTGLSTGPHLHFGIKPHSNDAGNGYFGKINPLPYLKMYKEDQLNPASLNVSSNNGSVRILKWYVNMKKGDVIQLGYQFKSPPESPQFYLLGPLEFRSMEIEPELTRLGKSAVPGLTFDSAIPAATGSAQAQQQPAPEQDVRSAISFQEARQWQLAIDADGSGTNTVSPSTSTTSAADQTYTFTFTSGEAATSANEGGMGSGQIQIQAPVTADGQPDQGASDNWTAPQGSAGSAAYTTAVGSGGAVVANVAVAADSLTPTGGAWAEDDTDMCSAVALDTTTFIEGTGSISCGPEGGNGPDLADSWGFDYSANQNWSNTCNGGGCTRVGYWARSTGTGGNTEFEVGSGTDVQATQLGANCTLTINSANTWEYKVCNISSLTLTTVRSLGWICTSNTCSPYEGATVNIDEILVGPGVPTFSGQNVNVRILTATTGQTIAVTYGSGGGTSGVDNPSFVGTYTFPTLSKTQVNGTLTSLSGGSPTIQLCTSTCGPTNDQLLRHQGWFNNGVEQAFYL